MDVERKELTKGTPKRVAFVYGETTRLQLLSPVIDSRREGGKIRARLGLPTKHFSMEKGERRLRISVELRIFFQGFSGWAESTTPQI